MVKIMDKPEKERLMYQTPLLMQMEGFLLLGVSYFLLFAWWNAPFEPFSLPGSAMLLVSSFITFQSLVKIMTLERAYFFKGKKKCTLIRTSFLFFKKRVEVEFDAVGCCADDNFMGTSTVYIYNSKEISSEDLDDFLSKTVRITKGVKYKRAHQICAEISELCDVFIPDNIRPDEERDMNFDATKIIDEKNEVMNKVEAGELTYEECDVCPCCLEIVHKKDEKISCLDCSTEEYPRVYSDLDEFINEHNNNDLEKMALNLKTDKTLDIRTRELRILRINKFIEVINQS